MKKKIKKITLLLLTFSPLFTFAEVNCNVSKDSLSGMLSWIGCILSKQIIPMLVTLGVAGFIYGIIKFNLNPNNEKEKEKGKEFMYKGLIALFIMVSFWGIINIFINSLDLNNNAPNAPTLPTTIDLTTSTSSTTSTTPRPQLIPEM
jgi:hypothetical protein